MNAPTISEMFRSWGWKGRAQGPTPTLQRDSSLLLVPLECSGAESRWPLPCMFPRCSLSVIQPLSFFVSHNPVPPPCNGGGGARCTTARRSLLLPLSRGTCPISHHRYVKVGVHWGRCSPGVSALPRAPFEHLFLFFFFSFLTLFQQLGTVKLLPSLLQ